MLKSPDTTSTKTSRGAEGGACGLVAESEVLDPHVVDDAGRGRAQVEPGVAGITKPTIKIIWIDCKAIIK